MNFKENINDDHFWGIFRGGVPVRKQELSDIAMIPSLDYILKAEYRYTYEGPINSTRWYQYTFIDKQGNPKPLEIGNFRVLYIDEDRGCTNFFGRNIYILDISKDRKYTYKSEKWAPEFVNEELVPFLEKLNEYGGWEEFYDSKDEISEFATKEVHDLYKEVVQLRKERDRFTQERTQQQEELKSMESKCLQLTAKNQSLQNENDRLNGIVNSKSKLLGQLFK